MSLKVITPPSELITVEEAADFMRVDSYAAESTVIESMITAARVWVENYIRRAIGVQTLELTLPAFPKKYIFLRPPLISITSVKHTVDEVEETLTVTEDYKFFQDTEPAELFPAGSYWPQTDGPVKIRYQTGYSNSGDSPQLSEPLPASIRTAILLQVSDLYHNREAQVEKPLSSNQTLERLLSGYRLEMGI